MNSSENNPVKRRISPKKMTAQGGIVGVLLLLYALMQPILSKQLGIDLPRIPVGSLTQDNQTSDTRTSDSRTSDRKASDSRTNDQASSTAVAEPKSKTSEKPVSSDAGKTSPSAMPPLSSSRASSTTPKTDTRSATQKPASVSEDSDLLYGILRPSGRESFVSPAGLLYTPGSAEGHRLDHLKRHTADQPSRPGKHGVFDGGMEQALQVLDQAYQKALRNDRTTKTVDDGRTIYTVDMGKRIGYIGGRDGNRQRKPMARRVRMVLDGKRVITAYPL